jgi:hypothetical protein
MSNKSKKPPVQAVLSEANLINLQLQNAGFNLYDPKVEDLDYPCKDKSSGVKDFSDWKYFEKLQGDDFKAYSQQASHIWCPNLLKRISRQQFYFEDMKIKEKEIHDTTPINKTNLAYRIRIQRAKAAAGRYSRVSKISVHYIMLYSRLSP